MITPILAASGFLCAIVVLIVERGVSRDEIRKAKREGYMLGYREACTFRDSDEAKFFRGIKDASK
jgi:hypothetical protein